MASCGVVERSALCHAERYNARMNQPCKQALAEKPLKSVVCAPIAAVGATKQLEFEDEAVFPVARPRPSVQFGSHVSDCFHGCA